METAFKIFAWAWLANTFVLFGAASFKFTIEIVPIWVALPWSIIAAIGSIYLTGFALYLLGAR